MRSFCEREIDCRIPPKDFSNEAVTRASSRARSAWALSGNSAVRCPAPACGKTKQQTSVSVQKRGVVRMKDLVLQNNELLVIELYPTK